MNKSENSSEHSGSGKKEIPPLPFSPPPYKSKTAIFPKKAIVPSSSTLKISAPGTLRFPRPPTQSFPMPPLNASSQNYPPRPPTQSFPMPPLNASSQNYPPRPPTQSFSMPPLNASSPNHPTPAESNSSPKESLSNESAFVHSAPSYSSQANLPPSPAFVDSLVKHPVSLQITGLDPQSFEMLSKQPLTFTFRLPLPELPQGPPQAPPFSAPQEQKKAFSLAVAFTLNQIPLQPQSLELSVKIEEITGFSSQESLPPSFVGSEFPEREETKKLSLFDKIEETRENHFPKKVDSEEMKLGESVLSTWLLPTQEGQDSQISISQEPLAEPVPVSTSWKNCTICLQIRPRSYLFSCDKCKRFACQEHRRRKNLCEDCFFKIHQTHPFYEKICRQLIQTEKSLHKVYPSGKVTFLSLANIFQSIAEESGESGLLVIGNHENKKGFCFLNRNIMVTSFGEQNIVRLGKLLVQHQKITEEQLSEALNIQKESKAKLGEILISLNAITREELNRVVKHQICKEVFTASRWPKSLYKFKSGQIPSEVMETLSPDFQAEVENPFAFKKTLSAVFQHLYFMMTPGLFVVDTNLGKIGIFRDKKQIELVLFQPKKGLSLGEELLAKGKITSEQLRQAQHLVHRLSSGSLVEKGLVEETEVQQAVVDFLIQQGFVEEVEVKKVLRFYLGKILAEALQSPDAYQFFEGEELEKFLGKFFRLDIGYVLQDILYDVVKYVEMIPALSPSAEIFSLIFDRSSSSQIIQDLKKEWHQLLSLEKFQEFMDPFESVFLMMMLLKSNLVHQFRSIQQHAFVLSKNSCSQEACLFLESALELVPNSYEVLNFLAQTYSRIHLQKKSVETYRKILQWARNPQEFVTNAKILFQMDSSDIDLGYKVFDHLVAQGQIQNAIKVGIDIAEHLTAPEQEMFYWKMIQLEDPPRDLNLRLKLLNFYLTNENLKGVFSLLKTLEQALSRTRDLDRLEKLYQYQQAYEEIERQKEIKTRIKHLKEGIVL